MIPSPPTQNQAPTPATQKADPNAPAPEQQGTQAPQSAIDAMSGAAPDGNPAEAPQDAFWEPDEDTWGKRIKVKAGDQEEGVALRDLRDAYQVKKLSEQKISEIARERHEYRQMKAESEAREAELTRVFRDPAALLEYRIEADPESALQWVQDLYDRAVEYSKLSPAERKVRWFEKIEAQRQESAKQQAEAAYQKRTQAFWSGVLTASTMDPSDPLARTVYQETKQIVDGELRAGRKVSKSVVVDYVKKRYAELTGTAKQRLLAQLKAEDIPSTLASEVARSQVKDARPTILGREPNGQFNGQRQEVTTNANGTRQPEVYDWMASTFTRR